MFSLKTSWIKLCTVGTQTLPDNDPQKKTSIGVNQLSAYIILINATFGFLAYFMTHSSTLLAGVTTEILLAPIPIYLNYRRHRTAAALMLYLILCAATFFFCCLLDNLAEVDLMIVVLIASARFLFVTHRSRVYSYLLAGVVLVTVQFNHRFGFIDPIEVNRMVQQCLFWSAYLVVIFLVISIFNWYGGVNEFLRALATEENKIKDKFISNAAHEIKVSFQSMFAIINNLHRMAKIEDPDGLKTGIDDLMAACKNTDSVIENIFEYERHKAGKLPEPDNKWIDIRSLLQGIVNVYSAFADEKGVTIELQLSDKLPEEIPCDKMKLRQIVTNLLHNAIKFTNNDTTVTVEAGLWGQHLTIGVKDCGDGVDDDMKRRMFDPFVTKNPEGLGLGLYIVRELVTAFEGSIAVADNKDGGTSITVSLPLAELFIAQHAAVELQ